MKRWLAYLSLIRPFQWIKNVFVLTPLIFSRELFEIIPLLTSLRAFSGFCLVAGAVYSINDLADVSEDREHPVKRIRPLASGILMPADAVGVAVFMVIAAAAVTYGVGWKYHLILASYFLLNLLYSLKLKEVVLLDVFLIAAGFMLRVLGGAYAIQVPVSGWIVLCTLFVSLSLAFGKRRGELVYTEAGSAPNRKVLTLYQVGFLDQMLTISAAGAVITYALYTVAPSTYAVFRTDKVIYTTVFVLFGFFRYLYLVRSGRLIENPTVLVTTDVPILLTGILWILACVFLIYSS